MNITLSKKMEAFQTSIFNELSALKKKMISNGHDVIDLSVGSPDLPPPRFVMEKISNSALDPAEYGYSLTGTAEFLNAVSYYYNQEHNVQLDSTKEVLMVMGSQDGLVHIPMVFADPKDYILVPDPGYTAYAAGIALSGATPYPMPLLKENNYIPDLDMIPEDIRKKAKMMIINFPGNPVPALATEDFFIKAIQFAKKYDILIVHDFAYCELYFGEKPISFLSVEGAKDVGIEFNSLSKSYNMAGCRIGYVAGNEEMVEAFDRLKSNLDYGVFHPIQKAGVEALRNPGTFNKELRSIYKQRRDVLVQGLNAIGWAVDEPEASMFVWAKIPEGYSSMSFAKYLLEKTGVVVTPGNAFGKSGEGFVRIAFVQDVVNLKRAVQAIAESGIFSPVNEVNG